MTSPPMRVGAVLALGAMVAAGCDNGVTAPRATDDGPAAGSNISIILELDVDTLSVNETTQLRFTVLSALGDTLTDRVVWLISSDVNIVTVSQTGLVTAEGPGTATLSALVDNVAARVLVHVHRLASISVTPSDTTLVVDDLLSLAITVLDVTGKAVVPVTRFSISDLAVVTNDTNPLEFQATGVGKFRARGVGRAMITAETEGLSASVNVEVKPSDVGSVTLSPDSLTVLVYDTAQLTVIVRDTIGAVIPNPRVVFIVKGLWSGTVDSNGVVTGLPGGCGSGTVIARSGGVNSNAVHIDVEGACWDY